jgi:hypothetical protein
MSISVIGDIKSSLDAFGVEQQACVLVFLMSYPLALGALLEPKGRRIAGAVAGTSTVVFIAMTDPWMHAVLLMALAVVGIGLFIAAVYVADFVSRRIALRGLAMPDEAEPLPEPAPAVAVGRERVPMGRPLSVKP